MSARLNRNPVSTDTGGVPAPVMQPSIRVPVVDKELLDYLLAAFPVSLSEEKSLRDYDRMLGSQQVIQHLKALWKEQNNS